MNVSQKVLRQVCHSPVSEVTKGEAAGEESDVYGGLEQVHKPGVLTDQVKLDQREQEGSPCLYTVLDQYEGGFFSKVFEDGTKLCSHLSDKGAPAFVPVRPSVLQDTDETETSVKDNQTSLRIQPSTHFKKIFPLL